MKQVRVLAWVGVFLLFFALGVQADPPTEIDYQGKILVNDIPLTGPGYFKYAIANESGSTNFWSQDGTTTGEPASFITNDCYNGVFSAILGASPMGTIDPDIFGLETSLYLRVWFSSDAATFDEMLPSQDLLSSPYAINSDLLDGYHASELISAATNAFTETDPVFEASPASAIAGLQIEQWNVAFDWGDHSTNGYLTAETDPIFVASDAYSLTSAMMSQWDLAYGWGDHSTNGYLTAETDPVFGASPASGIVGLQIEQWNVAFDWGDHSTNGYLTAETDPIWTAASNLYYLQTEADNQFVDVAGDTMTGALKINDSVSGALRLDSAYSPIAIGASATGGVQGVAMGNQADAADYGVAIGYQADGSENGTAVGYNTRGYDSGVAIGSNAKGSNHSIGIGSVAHAAQTNIAIGYRASALSGQERIAIGHNVTNDVDDTARLRGEFYMDGGVAIYGRTPFATGPFKKLLPLPPLDNVVYVSTNGTSSGPGTMDRPFDTPQNGYNYAATIYAGQPAALVIAAGQHGGLNMHAGNVHVLGQSRCELLDLTVSAPANAILGKQRVENIIVQGVTTVAADGGSDVKFHNSRFESGLLIYGSGVEVQDCYAENMDGSAVDVGTGASMIQAIALYNSSFRNASATTAAVLVNLAVQGFEMMGCHIVNPGGGPCIEDQEPGPMTPTHLYTHNYLRGVSGSSALLDVIAGTAGPTITFTQNTVLGDVGISSNTQFYANNIVYGLINNTGGPGAPGWSQAGVGIGLDAAGNTEHQGTVPSLPASWLD